jgi:hypothetical protein
LALVRVVAYIKATRELGIRFRNTFEVQKMVKLCCWVDAAYATHADSKSHTGYCFSVSGDLDGMFFARVKQSNITISSTNAAM